MKNNKFLNNPFPVPNTPITNPFAPQNNNQNANQNNNQNMSTNINHQGGGNSSSIFSAQNQNNLNPFHLNNKKTVLTAHADFMMTGGCGYSVDCQNYLTVFIY